MNVTTQDLISWSASFDLAERYQHYIDRATVSSEVNDTFFNCTKPWFGSWCQYSFDPGETKTLADIIEKTFAAKRNYIDPHTITNLTCYIHLVCDRGGLPMCLDWHEICNGQVDCFNSGVDETHCFELEINECDENEYLCHNGLCIAHEFWQTGDHNLFCSNEFQLFLGDGNSGCFRESSSECEDELYPPGPRKFPCGDGQCVRTFEACENGRHYLLTEAMSAQGNLSHDCWVALVCLTKILDRIEGMSCYDLLDAYNPTSYIQSCEPLNQFPTIPVLFDHVHFLYRKKNAEDLNIELPLPPDYICYDEHLCEFLTPTFYNDSKTCRHSHEMGIEPNTTYSDWFSIIRSIEPYFHGCLTSRTQSKNDLLHTSLYCCKNSSKCISKHRIIDGISDCYLNDDEEQFELSCSINHTHRFKCHNDDNKCQSPLLSKDVCFSRGQHNLTEILFQEICDRVVHLLPETIDGRNYTDETECEYWPCSNIYTRCDGFWNCPDGADEANCTDAMCRLSFLACLSLDSHELECVSVHSFVNDEIIDCLGAADDFDYCLEKNSDPPGSPQFLC